MTNPANRTTTFRALHQSGCFVIPNPWDAGSARMLQHLGFQALATTSAGLAWSLGKRDNNITLDDVLTHLRAVCNAVTVPINADFENGFAIDPKEVANNVTSAVATGVAGLSIEDSTGDANSPLYNFDLSVERIHASRSAIDATGTGVLLTGRSEGFICGRPDIDETIRRLAAYAAAGADVLYAPGLRATADIRAVVEAVAPKPVNVLVSSDWISVNDLRELGVRRVSVGGALARSAWTGALSAAREIAKFGTFSALTRTVPSSDIELTFETRG